MSAFDTNKKDTNEKLTVEVNADGIYLIVDNGKSKVTRQEILTMIEKYGVKDIDFSAINEIFKSTEKTIRKKISINTNIIQKKESVSIEVNREKLEAHIKFTHPINCTDTLSVEEILTALDTKGIRFGILKDEIEKLVSTKEYEKSYLVAVGVPPVHGVDGYLDFHFDTGVKSRKPKELDGGNLDYKNLHMIEMASCGQKLISSVPPKEGIDGTNVFGTVLTHKKGKPSPPLLRGKNVSFSQDETYIVADIGGQILYIDKKISVSPVFDVSGDVDNSTGNIDFNGSICIKGSVLTGFTVRATGNIEVHGVVDGATIISEAHVFLFSGVQGGDKATITAQGNLEAKYISHSTITVGGDIISGSIVRSQVRCNGKVILNGKNGFLVGGKVVATQKIAASVIGSSMATLTEIELGHAPEVLEAYRVLNSELKGVKEEYVKINNIVERLTNTNKQEPLPEDKKNQLLKLIRHKMYLREKITDLQGKIGEYMVALENQNGSVTVTGVIHPGVKVLIGNALMYVRDDIKSSRLRNDSGKIVIEEIIE